MPWIRVGGKKVWRNSMRSKTMRGRKLNPKQKKEVKTLIARRQELKFFSTNASGTMTSTLGIASMSDIPQGSTDSDRDADRLQLCGTMDIRVSFTNGLGATGDLFNTIRFIIFQWHPNSTPTTTSILLNGPTGAVDVHSHYNHDNRQEYKILLDRTIKTFGPGSSTSNPTTSGVSKFHRYLIPLGKKVSKYMQFQAGSTTGTNKIYYILGSDSALATHPSYLMSTKLFFRDS